MPDPSLDDVGTLVVMGVSGVGKTTVGQALAERLGRPFLDADDLHPAANVAAMASGRPLTEAERRPWIERIVQRLEVDEAEGNDPVLACSALSRASRAMLRGASGRRRFVFLKANAEVIAARLRQRRGHFMPPSLLESQFRALEEPEGAVVIDASRSVGWIVERVVGELGLR